MKKKKSYIAPNLTIIKVEIQQMVCTSPGGQDDDTETEDIFDLGNRFNEQGKTTINGQYEIGAKRYDAWSSWDE